MQAKEIQISQFLSQSKTKFIIPVYQRNYDWSVKECAQLIKDIENVSPNEPYFMGSIVHRKISNLTNQNELVIIDGQQRITTLTILLYVIAEKLHEAGDPMKDEIWDLYLHNKYDSAEVKLKLKPIESDFNALINLFQNNRSQIPEGNKLLENYFFFSDEIRTAQKALELYSNFNSLTMVEIALDEKDDPQKIFLSLNSTGLELSQADLLGIIF